MHLDHESALSYACNLHKIIVRYPSALLWHPSALLCILVHSYQGDSGGKVYSWCLGTTAKEGRAEER